MVNQISVALIIQLKCVKCVHKKCKMCKMNAPIDPTISKATYFWRKVDNTAWITVETSASLTPFHHSVGTSDLQLLSAYKKHQQASNWQQFIPETENSGAPDPLLLTAAIFSVNPALVTQKHRFSLCTTKTF